MKTKAQGFLPRAAVARPTSNVRQTLEAANLASVGGQVGREAPAATLADLANAAGEGTYVPRPDSPSGSLAYFAAAGDELAARRGTVSTTDWSTFDQDEMAALANCAECPDSIGGDVAYLFDADDQASVEILCNNCGGAGHLARKCPSPRKARSHKYMASLHLAQAERKDGRGPQRRVPGRGQRPPFRSFSRRFQPRRSLPPGLGHSGNPRTGPKARSAEEGEWELRPIGAISEDSSTEPSSSSSASLASERINSATDTASRASTTASNPPFAFSTSDDALFSSSDRMRVAIEREPTEEPVPMNHDQAMQSPHGAQWLEAIGDETRAGERSPNRIGEGWQLDGGGKLVVATVLATMAAFATACEYISKNIGYAISAHHHLRARALTMPASPVALFRLVIILIILVVAPLGRGAKIEGHEFAFPATERALINGRPDGYLANPTGIEVCVDSGATTTAIPEEIADQFPQRVLESNPSRKLYIADDKGLTIVKVIESKLPIMGFRANDPDEEMASAEMPCSRALVVRGMKKNMILLSTRVMKKDGVNTYLNDDNSLGRSDCLLIKKTGIVIPFVPSSNTYNIVLDSWKDRGMATAPSPFSPNAIRSPAHVHTGLGHVGKQRINASKLTMDGVTLRDVRHDEATCQGCRLGNTGKAIVKHARSEHKHGDATLGFDHFGQQMDSDISTGYPPSFPHHFTCMLNFIDRYGHETFLYFLRTANAHEVSSAAETLQSTIKHRLVDGKVGRWKTDNGLGFIGEETEEMAKHLCRDRGFQVPNDSDTLAVPERSFGVIQRMLRSMLAHAFAKDPPGTGQCLWTWGAQQAVQLSYYLPTSALTPPQSPYEFTTGKSDPVDLSWARTMFCDCTVTIAERDRDGKLGNRSADACHLGYDIRRGAHFCYVPRLSRLSSFTVTEWREDSFTIARTISADTPTEYVESRDLPVAPVTAAMMPRRYFARAGTELAPLKVVFVFGGTEEENTAPAILREQGHDVTVYDLAVSDKHDLRKRDTQKMVLTDCRDANFVFMSPPCDTASIAHWPPWRLIWSPKGADGLRPDQQAKVDEANTLYDFTGELAMLCVFLQIKFLIESAASRRVGPKKCIWQKYANNGFLWDYPAIAALSAYVVYLAYAQCFFGAFWQKYTGLLIDKESYHIANRIFGHADCACASHKIVLKGYDESGVARTRLAQKYVPANAQAFATYIVEACGSNQEGERGDQWSEALRLQNHDSLCVEIAASANDTVLHHADITNMSATLSAPTHTFGKPLPPTKPVPTHHRPTMIKHPEPTEQDELEVWLDDAEGAYRVSEVGSIPIPKTVEEAKKSEWWPLFKAAMEEEIKGKLANHAWHVVRRPADHHVLKSKWVFTVKYNDDGSIKLVKARFVGCGYSQIENDDYDKVFASNLSSVAFRILIGCIADEDLCTDHTDAVKAFTQADVDHLIYVEMPEGFGSSGHVLLLLKALEGIKQGAYLWFKHNRAAWTKLGATSWTNEPNLYYFPTVRTRVGVFADDTLSGYPEQFTEQYKAIKKEYSKMIKIDSFELSPVLKFTGCQFDRNRADGTITVHMERYIEQLCDEYKGQFEPCDLPYGESEKERKSFDNMLTSGVKHEKGPYLQLMGKLVWPSSMVRLDITFPVNKLCSKASDPDSLDYTRGLRVIGYLSTTKRLGITFGGRIRIPMGLKEHPVGLVESGGLYVVHDNSFGTSARPMGGYVVMFCNGAVDWSAGALKLVPVSSHEAESAQASRAAKAGTYARMLCRNNGRVIVGATPCFGDNKAHSISSQQVGSTARTRYYERAVLLFKRAVLLRILSTHLVSTDNMVADIFTKATDKATFTRMRNSMMNVHGSLRSSLEKSFRATTGSLRRLIGSVYGTIYDAVVTDVQDDPEGQ